MNTAYPNWHWFLRVYSIHIVHWSWHSYISQQNESLSLSPSHIVCFYSVSFSLICLHSCVHPLIVFECMGAEWHSSNFMATRQRVDSHSSSEHSGTPPVCFHFLSPPTHLPSSCSTSSHFHASLSFWLLREPWGKHSLTRFMLPPPSPLFQSISHNLLSFTESNVLHTACIIQACACRFTHTGMSSHIYSYTWMWFTALIQTHLNWNHSISFE